jgi:hypothetical protein
MRKKLAAAIFVLACLGMYAQVTTVDVAYQRFVLRTV